MSDDKNGVKAFSDERSGFLFELRIKTGKRLIEYEKVSAEQKRARNSDPALLTAMSRTVQPWNVSGPAQAAGVAALGEVAFLHRTRQIIREERRFLRRSLEKMGLRVCPSCANYLLFYSPLPLHQKLLEKGIQIRDCGNYHGLGPGWCRIAVKTHQENQVLVSALGETLEEC